MSKYKTEYIFVYGTLMSSIPSSMSKFVRRRATLIGKATAKGNLYDLGSYPGFVSGKGRVHGELYRLDKTQIKETLDMLDAYEGVTGSSTDEYRRVDIKVQVNDGGEFMATTYEYKGNTRGKTPINKGEYLPYYQNNKAHRKFTGHD